MVDLFCDSFEEVPRRILLDIPLDFGTTPRIGCTAASNCPCSMPVRRAEEDANKVRSFHDFRYAARSWREKERRVIARIEAPPLPREGARQRHALCRHQSRRHAPLALRGALLWSRLGRKSDQSPQAAPRLGSHLLQQGHGQPVPPPRVHRRLLALAHAQGPGTQNFVLARRAVRHTTPRLNRDRRPASPKWSLGSRSRCRRAIPTSKASPARRPRPAAVTAGATCPRSSPSRPPPTTSSKTETARRPPPSRTPDPGRRISLMNEPG